VEEEIAGGCPPKLRILLGRRISRATNVKRRDILPGNANPKTNQNKCMQTWKKRIQTKTKMRTFSCNKTKGVVNKNYLLLDIQSTVDQIANPDLLTNIRKSQKPIVVHYNAGKMKTDLVGELGDMMVHHNPKSKANVLSLHLVKQKHWVTHGSWDRNGVFVVYMLKGVVEFKPSEHGLYYIDVSKEGDSVRHMLVYVETHNETTTSLDEGFVMVNTVRANFEGYTKHKIEKAQDARCLQRMGIPQNVILWAWFVNCQQLPSHHT
jgi:hypothetical protein